MLCCAFLNKALKKRVASKFKKEVVIFFLTSSFVSSLPFKKIDPSLVHFKGTTLDPTLVQKMMQVNLHQQVEKRNLTSLSRSALA